MTKYYETHVSKERCNINKHDKIIANIKASMSFEGLEPSDYTVSLLEQYLEGKITLEYVISKIKEKHNISKGI